MSIENPEITLKEEYALGIPAIDAPATELSSWAIHCNVDGSDGKQYFIDTILVGGFGADVRILSVRTGEGTVNQIRDSIYRIVNFPPPALGMKVFPRGAMTAVKQDNQVLVEMEGARVKCKDDKTWHYVAEDKEAGIKVDLVHSSVGFPSWYGKDEPQAFSPHSIAYGYFWAGHVEGTLYIDGKEVQLKGKGARERTSMLDSCPAESGGWHEWIWFHFDEAFGTMDEMKISKFKDGSLYLTKEQKYLTYRTFNIEHHDWAYHTELGAFIPTRYRVIVETDAGILTMESRVIGAGVWAVVGSVPDFPFALLHWDDVSATFTHADGREQKLTNGRAASITRQWKPYPRVFMPEAFGLAANVAEKPIL